MGEVRGLGGAMRWGGEDVSLYRWFYLVMPPAKEEAKAGIG